jgi:hypothetical protein
VTTDRSTDPADAAAREVAAAVSDLTGLAEGDDRPARLERANRALLRSAKAAGATAVANGQWLAETVVELGAHLQFRTAETLSAHYGGLTGDQLAEALIRTASRASASVGAAAGTVMAAEELLPPAWLVLPFELLAETAAVAGIEMKLIAELHEVYGQPIPVAGRARSLTLARAWAERRGVSPSLLAGGVPALTESLGRGTRRHVIGLVRKRLLRRAGANLATAAPFLIGAAAGAAVNRRSTRKLGRSVVNDLTGV